MLEEMKEVIEQKIKSYNFEIGEIEEWGNKLLAYPIKKENRGYYILYKLYNKEENAQEKADSLAKEIDTLQYAEDKILKFILVKL
jgi:small subunit ribosomal protein S6